MKAPTSLWLGFPLLGPPILYYSGTLFYAASASIALILGWGSAAQLPKPDPHNPGVGLGFWGSGFMEIVKGLGAKYVLTETF